MIPPNSQLTGLRRVLFVNSGKLHLAQLDLRQPSHMHGGNNAGKTTIVNAIQFAFIDKFGSMVWDEHTTVETRKHYFKQFSSIVFEVNTPSGPQCLLILGLGPGSSFQYERWVYSGSLEPRKFYSEKDGVVTPIDTPEIKLYLAEMSARKMNEKDVEKWISGRGEAPFAVAPLKKPSDFESYRMVFTNLLRLKRISPDKMRQLLVTCSDVILDEINLRDKYQDRYTEFSGKLEYLNKIEKAKPVIEKCVEKNSDLSTKRKEYSMKYNFLRNYAGDLSNDLIMKRELLKKEIDEFVENKQNIDGQLDKAREEHTDSVTKVKMKEHDIELESERIEDIEKLSLLDLTSKFSEVSEEVRSLTASISRSNEEDLDDEREKVIRQLQVLKAELEGKITLKRLIRDMTDSDNISFNAWKLILSEEITDRIQGEGFTIQERDVLQSDLIKIKSIIKNGSLTQSGLTIPLDNLDAKDDILTSEQIKMRSSGLENKKISIDAAISAREQNEKTRKRLQDAKSEERKLADIIHQLENLESSKAELSSMKNNLLRLIEESEILSQKRDEISFNRDELITKSATSRIALEKVNSSLRSIQSDMGTLFEPAPDWANKEIAMVEGEDWDRCFEVVSKLNSQTKKLYTTVIKLMEDVHEKTDGRFKRSTENESIDAMREELQSLSDERITIMKLQDSLVKGLKGDIRDFMVSFDAIKRKASSFNKSFKQVKISDLDWFKIEVTPADSGIIQAMERIRAAETLMQYVQNDEDDASLDSLFDKGKISLEQTFSVNVQVSVSGEVKRYSDLNRFESQGTSVAVKLCFHVEMLRSMMKEDRGELPIFLDEVEKLDPQNLKGIIDYCRRLKFNIITASPRPSSAIEVNYWLDRSGFVLPKHRTDWGEEDE